MFRRGLQSGCVIAFRNNIILQKTKLPIQVSSISFDVKNQQLQHTLQATSLQNSEDIDISFIKCKQGSIELEFSDGVTGSAPHLWLRENCQCPECFDHIALGRKFLMNNLQRDVIPTKVWQDRDSLKIRWTDKHEAVFNKNWLHYRAFTGVGKEKFDDLFQLKKETWGKDLSLDLFDYEQLFKDDRTLLNWLKTIETKGVAMIKNTPKNEDSGPSLIDHVAYVKPSHYGRHSPVINRPNSNNVAFTNGKLGMHTDLAQYDYQAGIICIHAMVQHEGTGGETIISDGLYAADLLRQNHPEDFKRLTTTDVYFWDKGTANFDMEMDSFHKINRGPILKLNNAGKIEKISINNAVRDSFMDCPPEEINSFYQSMMTYNELLYNNAYLFKMKEGDMLAMDNVRCAHGREGYAGDSPRHIESSYLDWDEARCRRRRLEEKLKEI